MITFYFGSGFESGSVLIFYFGSGSGRQKVPDQPGSGSLREYLYSQGLISAGGAGSDFIDIDQYDPSIYKFDMFSPDELLNGGNSFVSYWGFDHTGKKVRGSTDINK